MIRNEVIIKSNKVSQTTRRPTFEFSLTSAPKPSLRANQSEHLLSKRGGVVDLTYFGRTFCLKKDELRLIQKSGHCTIMYA